MMILKKALVVAVTVCYGPDTDATPPDDVLRRIAVTARFTKSIDKRAIERVIADGVLLRERGSGWNHRWPGAYQVFLRMVEASIWNAVDWLYKIVVNDPTADWEDLKNEVYAEVTRLARVLARDLVDGCGCWRHYERMGLTLHSKIRKVKGNAAPEFGAIDRCRVEHDLSAWDGEIPLSKFLFAATVSGALRVAKKQDPDQSDATPGNSVTLKQKLTIFAKANWPSPS